MQIVHNFVSAKPASNDATKIDGPKWNEPHETFISATDRLLGRVSAGAGEVEEIPVTDFIQSLFNDPDAATARTTLGLTLGVDVQPYDPDLAAIAGLTRTRGDLIVGGASGWTDLALGTSGYHLQSDGTDVGWAGFLQAGSGAVTRTWQDKARDAITPLDFGAAGTFSEADRAADQTGLQAAITHWLSTSSIRTLDLAGKRYVITVPLTAPATSIFDKAIINGTINASSTFSGAALLDFSALTEVNGLKVMGLELACQDIGTQTPRTSGLLLDNTIGADITLCEVKGFTVYGIKNITNAAASEMRISHCRVTGGSSGAYGIDLDGFDNEISECIIRECERPIYLRDGANSVKNCHIYNFNNTSDVGIYCDDANNLLITGNYIDGVYLHLINPQSCTITGNKFLVGNSADVGAGFEFVRIVPTAPNSTLYDFHFVGNTMRVSAGANVDSIQVDTSGGSLDSTEIFADIWDNGFFGVNDPPNVLTTKDTYALWDGARIGTGFFAGAAAHLSAWDVDGSAWVNFLTLTANNTPSATLQNITSIGIGTATADRILHAEADDASNNAVTQLLRLTHTTSGSPAAGIGVGIEFEAETAAGNNEVGAIIQAVTDDVSAGSEDFVLDILLMLNGAAATRVARLSPNGSLDVGPAAGGTGDAFMYANGTSAAELGAVRFANSASDPDLLFQKSRGTTVGAHTIVQSGDGLGEIHWGGSDGSSFIEAASIKAFVDGTPGTNDMPGRIVFRTTPDGSGTSVEALRIDNAGDATFAQDIIFGNSGSGILGTTTNDNADAGNVGEIIESTVLQGAAVSLTASTPANITSISLTAGDWDVWAILWLSPAATTSITAEWVAISTTSATIPTSPDGAGQALSIHAAVVPNFRSSTPVAQKRLSLSATTTVYLVGQVNFTVDTCGGFGYIGARRRR